MHQKITSFCLGSAQNFVFNSFLKVQKGEESSVEKFDARKATPKLQWRGGCSIVMELVSTMLISLKGSPKTPQTQLQWWGLLAERGLGVAWSSACGYSTQKCPFSSIIHDIAN